MTTEAQRIILLGRMVQDAEESACAAELELAAVLVELAAAHVRIDALEAEAAAAASVMSEQQQLIEAHQHASVLALEAHRAQAAEIDRWRARVMGGIMLWSPEGSRN